VRPTLAQVQSGSRLLTPPEAKTNDVAFGVGAVVGMTLLVLWVVHAPRLRVKRFSTVFWVGLALCALLGPLLGRTLQLCLS
jgi:hypothetical protein